MNISIYIVANPAIAGAPIGRFMRIAINVAHPMFIPDICWSAHLFDKIQDEAVPYECEQKWIRDWALLEYIDDSFQNYTCQKSIFCTKESALVLLPLMCQPRVRFELAEHDNDIRIACLEKWSNSLKF
jgi:hypothetical protein